MARKSRRKTLAPRRAPSPVLHLALPVKDPDHDRAASDIRGSGARAVLLLAPAREAARIVKALRSAGYRGDIVGGAPAGRRPFVEEAGEAAEGVFFPLLFDPESPNAAAFVREYEALWGFPPDFLAAYAYDAARLLIDAVRRAGPNRALVRDALAALAPWRGVTGTVAWDPTGRNESRVAMGVWRGGRAGKRSGAGKP